MKGASAEVAILSFFTWHDPFFHHAKFQLPLRPPSTFLGVFWNCWQILSSKIFLIFFLCKIWVIAAPNKHFLGVWYQKWMRNKLLLLHFFSTFLNPQRTTLTYSALAHPRSSRLSPLCSCHRELLQADHSPRGRGVTSSTPVFSATHYSQ